MILTHSPFRHAVYKGTHSISLRLVESECWCQTAMLGAMQCPHRDNRYSCIHAAAPSTVGGGIGWAQFHRFQKLFSDLCCMSLCLLSLPFTLLSQVVQWRLCSDVCRWIDWKMLPLCLPGLLCIDYIYRYTMCADSCRQSERKIRNHLWVNSILSCGNKMFSFDIHHFQHHTVWGIKQL